MTTVSEEQSGADELQERELSEAGYRYAFVFLLTLGLLVFVVVAPSRDWARAIALALQFLALLVVIGTSRASREVRRPVAALVGGLAVATVVLEATDVLDENVQLALSGLLTAAIPLALMGGLTRLVRARGVTLQAVAGALALYLLLGLVFAWWIGFAAKTGGAQYFEQTSHPTTSQVVYFSFTTMTTTGYGDLTPAIRAGRAISVVEMLLGQLYLVTVIGVLVGNLARRPRQ
jgi:Ion channel